jgi:hypothetical protein
MYQDQDHDRAAAAAEAVLRWGLGDEVDLTEPPYLVVGRSLVVVVRVQNMWQMDS